VVSLPDVRRGQFGVFTTAQAREAGLTRHVLRRLVETTQLLTLRRGVYTERNEFVALTTAERSQANAVAACLNRPGSVVSHQSAARIHGLPQMTAWPAASVLTVGSFSGRRTGRCAGTITRGAALPRSHIDHRGAWAVTSVARTLGDLARSGSVLDVLAGLDFALNRGLTSPDEVSAVANLCRSWPGGHLLPSLLSDGDPGAESPYESVARWQLSRSGYRTTTQVWAYDDRGPIGCGDLWLADLWTFLEVDGDVKYGARAGHFALLDEKRRQERLEEAGFGIARVAARDTLNRVLVVEVVTRAAHRAKAGRISNAPVCGYVGPPPNWANRGALIGVAESPE
jgi:hypothetical protein